MQAILNHRWVEHQPVLSSAQLAELLPVLAPVMAPKRRLPSVPKEDRKAPQKRSTNPPTSVVALVKRRATDEHGLQLCEVCGVALGVNTHHRQPRGMGGSREEHINTASNLLWVCGHGNTSGCHGLIENGREHAKDVGWLVPRPTKPIDVPVLWRGVNAYLDDDGGLEPVESGAA